MPKIRIKERDLTTNPLVGSTTNYILYVLSADQVDALSKTAYADLWNNLNKAPVEITLDEAKGIDSLTKEDTETQTSIPVTNNKFLEEAISLGGKIVIALNWPKAKEYCGDRNQYDIKFILAKELVGDASTYTHTELQEALTIAQKRKDCAVVYTKIQPKYDTREELTVEGQTDKISEKKLLELDCNYIDKNNVDKGSTDKAFFKDEVKRPVGKYVLPFYANEANGVHDIGDTSIQLDAGQAYILAFLNNVAQGRAEWLAIAGSTRGTIPGNYIVDGFLREEDIDNMQLRTYDKSEGASNIAINPIVNMNPWGTRIWGNRTCLPNDSVKKNDNPDESADQLVASSFANIRIAICDIKKALYKAARKYQFEQNTDVLWVNFTSEVNSLLEEMKSSYGIVGYRWKRETANERAKLKATLQIVPIEAVEDFDLTVELAKSLEDNVQIAE